MKNMKYTLDINKVEFKDLEGNDLKKAVENELKRPFNKAFGNFLYFTAKDISILEHGKKIYNGEVVELTGQEREYLLKTVLAAFSPLCHECVKLAIKEVN